MEGIIQVSRLLVYDTSNFMDFPIGGQLTSIGNFLRFLCGEYPARAEKIMLVGVTLDAGEVGRVKKLHLYGADINFLPVAAAERDLGNTTKSLRLRFAKGLLKYGKLLHIRKKDCNYIHTPEAYGVVKLLCMGAHCVIFSHGSYFNMERGFRFFKKNVLVKKGFVAYLKWILRNADCILLLDQDSLRDYRPYNPNLVQVGNSIVCPDIPGGRHELRHGKIREILFVGRLSKDKRVEPIIQAVLGMDGRASVCGSGEAGESAGTEEERFIHLTVVGDGEEYRNLIRYEGERVHFTGAVPPEEVKRYMRQADLLVMNSAFEGVPMTILEAISHALPVVSTNVGGIGEVLHFGQDSEETDGTAEGIRAAVRRIGGAYGTYSRNAYDNSKAYDYRTVNRKVYQMLCNYWREG